MAIKVLQVSEKLAPEFGGTALAIHQLANRLAAIGAEVSLLGLDWAPQDAMRVSLDSRIRYRSCKLLGSHSLGFGWNVGRMVRELGVPHLVHLHGLWRLHFLQVAGFTAERGIPAVMSTHGMLEPFALRNGKWKKTLARFIYQDRLTNSMSCLHATAEKEALMLRQLGFRAPIAVIPWGVEIPPRRMGPPAQSLFVPQGKRAALFLARFHPIKGLDRLLKAWSYVHKQFPNWVLVLAGYNINGYQAKIERLARDLGVSSTVIFAGVVQGQEKEELFATAELFVLPSLSENFGLVVAEALARELPVITTTGTPWAGIADSGCGWYIEPTDQGICDALTAALGKTSTELRTIGKNGRKLVELQFSVQNSVQSMMQLYRWLVEGDQQPHFLMLD